MPNPDYWEKFTDVTFVDKLFWAERDGGVRVSKRFFRPVDALCHFTYARETFSIGFSAYPVIVSDPRWLKTNPDYVEYYSRIIDTTLSITYGTLIGEIGENQVSDLLIDIQDSDLYDCLFNCPAERWPNGSKVGIPFEPLSRPVVNFSIINIGDLPRKIEPQVPRLPKEAHNGDSGND